jgi:DNA-binding CsgD family transcriptional regulator
MRDFQAIALHMHDMVLRLEGHTTEPVALSPRERECLQWIAEGKTVWECSIILGLSMHTVRCYLETARAQAGGDQQYSRGCKSREGRPVRSAPVNPAKELDCDRLTVPLPPLASSSSEGAMRWLVHTQPCIGFSRRYRCVQAPRWATRNEDVSGVGHRHDIVVR